MKDSRCAVCVHQEQGYEECTKKECQWRWQVHSHSEYFSKLAAFFSLQKGNADWIAMSVVIYHHQKNEREAPNSGFVCCIHPDRVPMSVKHPLLVDQNKFLLSSLFCVTRLIVPLIVCNARIKYC